MTHFVELCGERFRVLTEDTCGAWIISYDTPSAPLFVTDALQRVETPSEFIQCQHKNQTQATKNKLNMIQPLLEDKNCMSDSVHRRQVADSIAAAYKTTRKRVLRLYYRFLATGLFASQRSNAHSFANVKTNSEYNWAIRKYYFSAKKHSLRTTYEFLLLEKYTDVSGNLIEPYPSWSSFRHYFYDNGYHRNPQSSISRNGLSHYQRNERPAFGTAQNWKQYIGAYQVDAQEADIYLVSSNDRKQVIGRPNIYIAVDTATEMITGIFVSMAGGDEAVMRLICNSACDKIVFAQKYGVTINIADWPARGMPSEVISDKGNDFCSQRIEELCLRYGVQLESVPPYRSELKPLVERVFGLLNGQYKSLLRGKGVIEADAQERWSIDYRTQAILTLGEFTQVLIHCIINLNSRLLPCGQTPLQLWDKLSRDARLLQVDNKDLYLMSLPRDNKRYKLTRTGFRFRKMFYAPVDAGQVDIGASYLIAWDSNDCSNIYAVTDNNDYIQCALTKSSKKYDGLSLSEVDIIKQSEKIATTEHEKAMIENRVVMLNNVQRIISAAEEECKK